MTPEQQEAVHAIQQELMLANCWSDARVAWNGSPRPPVVINIEVRGQETVYRQVLVLASGRVL